MAGLSPSCAGTLPRWQTRRCQSQQPLTQQWWAPSPASFVLNSPSLCWMTSRGCLVRELAMEASGTCFSYSNRDVQFCFLLSPTTRNNHIKSHKWSHIHECNTNIKNKHLLSKTKHVLCSYYLLWSEKNQHPMCKESQNILIYMLMCNKKISLTATAGCS